MPGFRINNLQTDVPLNNYDDHRCQKSSCKYLDWNIERNTLDKFMNDKLFLETEKFIVLLEGVVYNSTFLKQKSGTESFSEAIKKLLEQPTKDFLQSLDGSCSGLILYKEQKRLIVFTSVLGEKSVFYYQNKNVFIAGSQLNYITDIMNNVHILKTPNEMAISQFLAYGFYLDDSTCIQEIKRLYPGTYLEFYNNTIKIHEYNKIEYSWIEEHTEDEWIQMLQESFAKAVKKILNKNEEYGYYNLIDISGGADSRMITYTAAHLKASHVLLDCYGESGCDDIRIAEKIAHSLGFPLVFRSIDNADCMQHVDQNIQMNNGATIYYGITGGKDMLEMLNKEMLGLELTGLLGDVFDGSMVITYPDGKIDVDYPRFRCSQVLKNEKDFVFPETEHNRFMIHKNELYWFHARGMLFGMTSYFIRQNFVEVATPFGDLDFLKVYLSIPWEMRVNGNLLRKWLIKSYPAAGDLKYANTGIRFKSTLTKCGKIEERFKVLERKIRTLKRKKPNGMNDVTFWYHTNPQFSDYIANYYAETVNLVSGDIAVKINKLYQSTVIGDKLLAITMLATYKNYII